MLFLFFQVSEDNKKVRRVTTKPLPEETAEARYDAKTKTVYCVSCVKHAVQLYSVIGVTLNRITAQLLLSFKKLAKYAKVSYLVLGNHLCTPTDCTYTSIQSAGCTPSYATPNTFVVPVTAGALELHITHIKEQGVIFTIPFVFSIF